MCLYMFFFFKQKTAYEMRISDWSSDVCSSDLAGGAPAGAGCGPSAVTVVACGGWFDSAPGMPTAGALVPLVERVIRSLVSARSFSGKLSRVAWLSDMSTSAWTSTVRSEERRVGKGGVRTC